MSSTNKVVPVDITDLHHAVDIVIKEQRASIGLLQRRMNIGYGYAFFIMQNLEELGVVSKDTLNRVVLKKEMI